jgi:hypothetical protein
MKQEVKIVVPTQWSAITLKTYLELQKDLKVYGDNDEGYIACLMHHLCGFNAQYLHQLDTETFTKIKNDLVGFMSNTQSELQRIINIDGVEYGFEPNLSKMAYGAYLDITKYDTFTIDDNWAKIMSILYRPIVKKHGSIYEIKDYDGNIDETKFLNVPMDVQFGALFFFVRLLTGLPSVILKSMMDSEIIPHNIKSILAESGKITPLLSNLQMETLDGWKI